MIHARHNHKGTFWSRIFTLKNLLRFLGVSIILVIIGIASIWIIFLRGIPDIESLEKGEYFRESTVIYDRENKPIYTLFKDGRRTYIPYVEISDMMKSAIVSVEDKTFFENPGIDLKGLVRAGLKYFMGSNETIKGTSTISQQLIKNTILSNERSLKRKIQEAYLSYKLNKNYSKEKILEMYLNAISFGYNANGIEEASKTYFGKSAKEVGPLGASILASLPKGPTFYSPYLHRDRLMGKVYVYPLDDPTTNITLDTQAIKNQYKTLYGNFRAYLSGITTTSMGNFVEICSVKREYVRDERFFPDSRGCIEVSHDDLLAFFGDIILYEERTASGSTTPEKYALEYTIGRKDFVAARMFEDGKIDGVTFKKILYDGLEFEFKKYSENIRYPYFVMYVKEYLESHYGKDIDVTAGLKVYTTIDPKLQEKAEELVRKQVEINKKQYGANSAALVSMDNKSGSILAMVGGPDYFDTENGGNNNMITASRQPGSSFKPLIYALAISKYPIGPESPIADIRTSFGRYIPDNYDNGFKGIMPVKKALSWSRNIPAVKMYYLAGMEDAIVKFGKSIGLSTLKENAAYGAPLAIGAAEVRPIDMMQAYSVLANLGVKRDAYVIEKIEDSEGVVLETHTVDPSPKPVFSPAAAYVVTKIISDPEARPDGFWRNALTIGKRNIAAKTGTSNKEMPGGKILPRDLWTAGYSPQITTVVWAGNVNGKETRGNCDGLNCAAGIWKPFMEFAHKDLPNEDWKKPEGLYAYTISKMSGKLATSNTPDTQKASTIMAVKLTEYDDGFKEEKIDTLCNGPLSENTPPGAIASVYIPTANPVIDGYDPEWARGFFQAIGVSAGTSGSGTFLARTDKPCERPGAPGNITINIASVGVSNTNQPGKKIIEASWFGDRPIQKASIFYLGEEKVSNAFGAFGTGSKNTGSIRTNLDLSAGEHVIEARVVDLYGFTYTEQKTLLIGGSQTPPENTSTKNPPVIHLTNPKEANPRVSLYEGDTFNLRFSTDIMTASREISISIDGKTLQTATAGDIFVIPISSQGISVGTHTLKVVAIDGNMASAEKNISLTILPR